MRATHAYADLLRFGRPVLTTSEAAVRLHLSVAGASKLLTRLVEAGLVQRIRHGLWSTSSTLDPLVLPERLTAPYPSYVSLLTALRVHGMLSQIPRATYIATIGPTRRFETTLGAFSAHHLAPEFFGGFTIAATSGIRLATPEKALLDVLYLSRGRDRTFARLPEIDLAATPLDRREMEAWITRIAGATHRTMVRKRLEALLGRGEAPGAKDARSRSSRTPASPRVSR